MPYTPPAAQSPAASRPETPNLSPSNSFLQTQDKNYASYGTNQISSKPYMASSRHRRNPSITETSHFRAPPLSPESTLSDSENDADICKSSTSQNAGASGVIRPTVSSTSEAPLITSSGQEPGQIRGRVRNLPNLTELQAAIRIIEQHRAHSPESSTTESTEQARSTLGLAAPRIKPSVRSGNPHSESSSSRPLSAGARKISHSRSNTESSTILDFSLNKYDSPARSTSGSDVDGEEDDIDLPNKPSLIRKKSGELVRPALRASSTRRRPSSMPGTPTYAKAVHFQESSLEHVRHFLQVDRPIAVSAGTSPVESLEDESEFPFGNAETHSKSVPFAWELRLANFPRESVERSALPIRMESVYLSPDTRILMGNVVVRNLSFHKLVVARFTLDYWKTTSEVIAEYNQDLQKGRINRGYDRFTFSIKLEDQANLENKTMFFCVRYNVNGQEYWDNNNSMNYQVDFGKRFIAGDGQIEKNSQSLIAPLRNMTSTSLRPRSMPSFEDFASNMAPYDFSSYPQPSSMVGDSPIRFRNRPSSHSIVPDAPERPKASSNQQAFGNRYDFGASLSAAIQASLGDKSVSVPSERPKFSAAKNAGVEVIPKNVDHNASDVGKVAAVEASIPTSQSPSKPAALTTEKPSLQSSSYHELLDKYCFFGSGKPASPRPQQTLKAQPIQLVDTTDGLVPRADDVSRKSTTTSSSQPPNVTSPVEELENVSNNTLKSSAPGSGSSVGPATASPNFGYPCYQPTQSGLFDAYTPTAILS